MCSDPYNEYISGDPSGFRAIKAPVFQGEQLPDIKLYGLDGKLNNEKEHVIPQEMRRDFLAHATAEVWDACAMRHWRRFERA